MKLLSVVVLAAAVSASPPQLHRQERGLLEDMWGDLRTGLGQISTHATRDIARIGQDVQPAMRQVESSLNLALEQMMKNNPLFSRLGMNTDRVGSEFTPVLSQANHEDGGAVDVAEDENDAPVDPFAAFGGLGGLLGGSSPNLDPFSLFGMSRRSWWDGPNVCVDRKVLDEGTDEKKEDESSSGPIMMMDMTMTSCRDGPTFHECTTRANNNGRRKTVVVRHECCYGYTREGGDEFGCSGLAMKSLDETIKDIEGEEFLELLDAVDMRGWLEENVTVFVPTDEAVEDFRHDLEKLNSIDMEGAGGYAVDDGLKNRRKKRQEHITIVESPSLESVLRGHMLDGFVPTTSLRDEDVLTTMDGDGSQVRVTIYNRPEGRVVMANCARVTSSDNFATNGVAHAVDRVLLPAHQTLAEIISSDTQFRRLAKALDDAGMMEELAVEGQLTFFAPTDEAFDALDDATKAKLEGGTGCAADILKNHLLHNVICSGVVEGKAKTVNALKKYLILDRDDQDVITVDGVKLLMRDIVGTNGVLHVVEEVLVPATARTVDQALADEGADTMAELFRLADFDLETLSNVTVFAPSEKALEDMPPALMAELKADKDKLRNFLLYHVAKPKTCKCDFDDNKVYPSALEDAAPLRMNKYGAIPLNLFELPKQVVTVQCGRLTSLDDEACGSMIHTVDKILLPPSGNTISILKDNEDEYSKFLELIKFAELENELSTEGPFTVLAPSNDAFEHVDEELAEKMFADKDAAVEVVYKHVIRGDHICCSGIPRHVPFLDLSGRRTAGGDVVSLRRSRGGHIYADRAEVTVCDVVAENGVVHQLDRLLVPEALETKEEMERNQAANRRNSSPWLILNMFNRK